MLKRFSYFIAYFLLVLMPIQALATANMLICNSVMQSQHMQSMSDQHEKLTQASASTMPCHQHMATEKTDKPESKSPCKSSCASLCANLCALTAMPVQLNTSFALNLIQRFDFNHQIYASIPQPNLQRPPITFI